MANGDGTAPLWDMTPIFPALDSAEFEAAFEAALQGIDDLAALFDVQNVRRRESATVNGAFVAAYEQITGRMSALNEQLRVLGSYIGCFTTTDAKDDAAKSLESELSTRRVTMGKLSTRYVAWVGTSDVDALLSQSELAKEHEYPIRRAHYQAQHQMSPVEEELAAELGASSLTGWAKLHGTLTALLTATLPIRGEAQTLPMSSLRGLASDPDREIRKAAFEAEQQAWEANAVPLAAALNGVKGYQQTVRKRRGYTDDVEPTLFANGIDRQTLDAMQAACVESFPDFRRYMDAKAKLLGLERLAWYDLNAPVGATVKSYAFGEAETFLQENFGRYSPRLAEFAERSFRERWVDAPPRFGKQGGAYCTGLRPGESRIFMNYDGSFNSVSTLAHELGHAYHNLNLAERKPMLRSSPSTLAETASIFCETLAFDAALEQSGSEERLSLLSTVLERNLMVVVDIHSRFLFEKAVFEKRSVRDLTVAEFCALMTDAQRQTYGSRVEPLHPYMWAVKGHYYNSGFYNYPYTFGLLFGLGLYACYLKEPDAFRAQYDNLLSSTGMADAKTLGERFGFDITTEDFWRSSLEVIRMQIAEFERLVG